MIISHSKKFIFFKPAKVAGTSLELAISKCCNKYDIITPIANLRLNLDGAIYNHVPCNEKKFYEHMPPKDIRKKVGEDIWGSYQKITIARNPYDMIVSRWFWMRNQYLNPSDVDQIPGALSKFIETLLEDSLTLGMLIKGAKYRMIDSIKIRKYVKEDNFDGFVTQIPSYFTNNIMYFDSKGNPYFDRILRFERLQQDYDDLCADLGIPKSMLPKAKINVRTDKRHYSFHYTNTETRKIVSIKFAKQLNYFGYKFQAI